MKDGYRSSRENMDILIKLVKDVCAPCFGNLIKGSDECPYCRYGKECKMVVEATK